jgi:predicted kinase
MNKLMVVQMHGEPGSGKSTVARALAPRIGAIPLDKDVIKAALLRAGAPEALAAPAAYEVFFAQAHAFVAAGHSIILDNPVYWSTVEARWLELSRSVDCVPLMIECVCPDRAEIARRLATRDALESQPRDPLDLKKHPGSTPTAYEPRLTLDTTRPLDALVERAVAYVLAGVPA